MTTYFITGATGLIGGNLIRKIVQSKEYMTGHCRIVTLVRNVKRFQSMFQDIDCSNIQLVEGDLCQSAWCEQIPENVDYIIHGAAPTASSYMISNPVETADCIVLGTRNVLGFAKQKQVKSMVFLSSMEVYGSVSDIGRNRKEEELGEIALYGARSSYPLGKRMAEHYCHIFAKEYLVPVRIARLAQTFGKGVKAEDNRVYMQFARSVVEDRDIVLKTDGTSMGNYCAIEDVVEAIFTILEKGASGEVYNVVNESNTMMICEMAHLVAKDVAGGVVDVRIELEDPGKTGFAPVTELRMSSKKLRGLGWKPTKTLEDMYRDVIVEICNGNK